MKEEKCCIGCNCCYKLMDPGHTMTGCIVKDGEMYLPVYKRAVLGREEA